MPTDPAEQQRRDRNRRLGVIALVVLVVVSVATAVIWIGASGGSAPRRTTTPIAALPHGVALGRPGAPVHVVVHEDFQCPRCRTFELASRDFLRADADHGRVYVEYLPYAGLDDYSSQALNAFAAVLHDKGAKAALSFHDRLFDAQPPVDGPWPDADALTALAAKDGASGAKQAIASLSFRAWVDAADAAAKAAGVTHAPTVLVDGRPIDTGAGLTAAVTALETQIAKG